jgi:urate oxidase
MGIVLGPNQYGKAEVRLVHVDRTTPRHAITDLTVTTQLRGDFAGAT